MLFRTSFSRFDEKRPRFPSVSGTKEKILYHLVYSDNGVKKLDVCGCTDLYAEIQSHRESTDLSIILSRLDPNQVSNMASSYSFNDLLESEIINVTQLPKNAGEMLNLVRSGQNLFDGLPIEVREMFNYSMEKFVSSFGSKEFAEKINYLNYKLNRDNTPVYDISRTGKIKPHVEASSTSPEVSTSVANDKEDK